MYQESIENFLSISGVLGVALICQRQQLYLHIKEQALNWAEKQLLTQDIKQVVTKIPEKFDALELRIAAHYACVYQLNHDFMLLILTSTEITTVQLRLLAAKQLKIRLQENLDATVSTFKTLTQLSQLTTVSMTANRTLEDASNYQNQPSDNKVTVEDLLNALNHLSQFSSEYIGKKVVISYWQSTRPSFEWLHNFNLNRSAEIEFLGVVKEPITALQHQSIKEWTTAFVKKCSQIIQDFPMMIEKKGLDKQYQNLLVTPPVVNIKNGNTTTSQVNVTVGKV